MPELNDDLAEAVKRWIDAHSLTQPVIASNGGPSSTTLTKVLSGSGNVRPVILSQLDRGLGWGSGHAARVLRGEEVPASFDWRSVSDRELLDEVERRMKGVSDAGATGQKTPSGLSAVPDFDDLAADHQGGPSVYEQRVAEQDRASEDESDDR